jgi:hypothetical protein
MPAKVLAASLFSFCKISPALVQAGTWEVPL